MPRKLCPTLIVIGGGFAGRAAIHHFITYVQDAQILLIDEKPYFEFSPAVLRCLVHPGHIRQITFPQHTDHDFAFLQGRVTHITAREVTVTRHINNSISIFAVPYDYCVWATGVDYAHPIRTPSWRRQPTVPRRRGEFGFFRHRVMSANQVLILGAGPIGVELAAELTALARQCANLRITLAASPRGVLPRFPRAAGEYATYWLTRRGVVVLRARMKKGNRLPGGRFQYTDANNSSTILTPDVVFDCTGAKSNRSTNALVAGGMVSSDGILRDGSVRVLETLQLVNVPHVFVAGDVSRVPGELDLRGLAAEKTAYAADESGRLAARNIVALMKGERLVTGRKGAMGRWPRDVFWRGRFPRLVIISLYKWHGILCVGPIVINGVLPALVKWMIEILGVAAAEREGAGWLILKLMEAVGYTLATLSTIIAERCTRRNRR